MKKLTNKEINDRLENIEGWAKEISAVAGDAVYDGGEYPEDQIGDIINLSQHLNDLIQDLELDRVHRA
jgi:hypothetical protein